MLWQQEERGSRGAPRTQGHYPSKGPAPQPPRGNFGEEATGTSQDTEMRFPRPGAVTSPGARPQAGERAAGGGGAAPRAQRGPRTAGSPPLTLGLRLHPSPPAAREGGWPRARGELCGPQRGGEWGRGTPGDRTQEKKTQGQQSAPRKPAFQLPRLLREPGPGAGPSHSTPPAPQSKSCTEARRTPPPLGLPYDSPARPPTRLPRTPAERGRGAVTGGRKERAFPERPDAGRVSCAPARSSPPRSGSWPIKPQNYAWAWSPSALPP